MAYKGFGKYKEVMSARSKDPDIQDIAQDGGTTTALMCYALDTGFIDGAVLTRKSSEEWAPAQYVATSRKEILESAKSVYALSPSLFQLKEATREKALSKVGYVGVPCQIEAVRKMQLYPFGARDIVERLALVIGIFCFENFYPESLKAIVEGLGEEPLEGVVRMRCASGKFRTEGEKGVTLPLKEASRYIQDGDRICPDLVAEWADISIGSVGSDPGWNTVFLRTKKGHDFFQQAIGAGAIETKEISEDGLKALEKLAVSKKSRAKKFIEKREKLGLYVTRDIFY
ncbi:MAG TPA: Coenzyme F420 hydrogenase/dehydrogenase, beta subunit C-terminal domain [Methanocella sp.]|uniref:Coenzyme F420 hydrogenase/dehydrogenase, beta subunit C-terminal domain n=1 Tax=Methanocella sp. TaxID=2052833 RepID=UPI002C0E92BB|nr:Coenzyme F420 hydrogenase/dehydrogenase, beta subunit C-terminal domain [Methanocella sp.]HTY91241.1 Coenzyme F420 hydrogenase/dehydrogenase, beta subunit C-terminal domain [Methanocella sp.]